MKSARIATAVMAVAMMSAEAVDAKGKSLTGIWTLRVEQIGLKLELVQTKNTVTGTLDWPHGDPIQLSGRLSGDMVTFAGDAAGENFSVRIDSTGRLKGDGTMSGTLAAHFVDFNDAHEIVRKTDQEIPWTAERGEHGIVHFPR